MSSQMWTRRKQITRATRIQLKHYLIHHPSSARKAVVNIAVIVKNSKIGGIISSIQLMTLYSGPMYMIVAKTSQQKMRRHQRRTDQLVSINKGNAKPDIPDHLLNKLKLIPKLVRLT